MWFATRLCFRFSFTHLNTRTTAINPGEIAVLKNQLAIYGAPLCIYTYIYIMEDSKNTGTSKSSESRPYEY